MTLLRTLPESNEPFSSTAVSSSSPHVWTLSALHFQEWRCHHWKWALKIQCPLIVVWSFSSVQISGTPGGPPTSSRTVTRGEYVEGHFRASSGKDDDILDSTFASNGARTIFPPRQTLWYVENAIGKEEGSNRLNGEGTYILLGKDSKNTSGSRRLKRIWMFYVDVPRQHKCLFRKGCWILTSSKSFC